MTLVLVLLAGVTPREADASEGELVLAAHPLYAIVDWDQRHPSGGGLALDVEWGLNDALWLRATTFFTAHPADADESGTLPSGVITVTGAFAGVSYAFDVLRVVPFVDVGLGALIAGGAGLDQRVDLGAEVSLGADYLYSRRLAFGGIVRYYSFLTNVREIPVYLYAGPRVSLRWD